MDWMAPHPAEPVLGVLEITLAPVHDAVPVAAFATVQGLADSVRFVQEVVVQPQPGKARAGQLAMPYRLPFEQERLVQTAQLVERRLVRFAPIERHQPRLAQKRRDRSGVLSRVEACHVLASDCTIG